MINLEHISKELERYKEAKGKALAGDWEACSEFTTLARCTPLETYCEQLIEKLKIAIDHLENIATVLDPDGHRIQMKTQEVLEEIYEKET